MNSASRAARRGSARLRSALFAAMALLLASQLPHSTLRTVGHVPTVTKDEPPDALTPKAAESSPDRPATPLLTGSVHGGKGFAARAQAREAQPSTGVAAAPPVRGLPYMLYRSSPGPAPTHSPQDTVYDEGLMELVADRLPPTTVVVLIDSAGSVLLPLEHVMSFLGLGRPGEATRILVPQIGGAVARVDTTAFTIVLSSHTLQLAPAEMPRRGDVVFLRAERLATLIEAHVNVDFATLTVTFAREIPFPAQQRIIAEQRRAMVLARQRWLEERAALANVPYDPLSGGAIADWEITTTSLDPAQLTTLRARAGVALFGGDLGGGAALEVGRNVDDEFRDVSLHYHRVFPRSRYATQLRIGDVLTTGLFTRHVRGVELSNRPFLRSSELSSILLQPDLPPGWEYEVFQGNQLIGYSVIGAADAVSVPLRAGATPLQVRMYGPAGEEIVRTLLYQAPVSMLRSGAVEYAAGGGRCAVGCDEFAHADVRYGVSSLFTAGAGVETITDSAGTAARPYFVYSMSSGTRATAELTYMPFELYSANLSFFLREGTAAYLRGNVSRAGFGPISIIGGERRRWDVEVNWDERLEGAGFLSQLRLGLSGAGQLGSMQRFRLSATGAFRSGYIEARYDRDDIALNRQLLTTRAAVFTPFSLRGRTLRPLISSAVGINDVGFALGELALSLQPTHASLLSGGLQWTRGAARPNITLGYSVRTHAALAALRVASSASGTRSSSATLSGSAALSPRGDIAFHPSTRTGYAGVSGIVFVDHDGDSVFSAGDEPVTDAWLVIGDQRVASDDRGRFRAWGLQPYQPTGIAIDSTRTPDPSLTTVRRELIVRPVPNMARPIDVPLVRTRELLGSVLAESPDLPTAGLTLELLHIETGVTTSSVTFSDGFFYVSRLRPGRYRLTLASASLQAIGASAPAPVEFTVPASGDDVAIELAPIQIGRR